MASLADLPELVGFFSYSREDDEDSHGALSALRTRIQGELRGQLGRTAKTFRLWQDKEAIPSGTMWETEIKNAVGQAAFFIPIITPTVIASPYCRFELESFLAREAALGRDDLVFPILYIEVPALEDAARRQNDPVLSLIARRQYADWSEFRYLDVNSTEVRRAAGRFCADIRNALYRPWVSPEEHRQQEEAAARLRAEADRQHQEVEVKRRADEEARQMAAVAARQKREAAAEQQRADTERRRAEERRLRDGAEAKHRAEVEERRQFQRTQAGALWPPSRRLLMAGSVGVVLLAAIGAWVALSPTSVPVTPPPAASTTPIASVTPAPPPVVPTALAPATTAPQPVASLSVAQERALKPKDTFQECSECPVMTVVPAGSFTMGAPTSAQTAYFHSVPQHTITIAGQFAVARSEVTVDQFSAFVRETGYDAGSDCLSYDFTVFRTVNVPGRSWRDPGFPQTGSQPVVCLGWNTANAYTAWLTKKTGKPYRLLSEAEYEYATRAGTQTVYPWGNAIGENNANCNGCGSQWDKKQTAPVGSFAPNNFGLYDMVGNVFEWTEDCDHNDYNDPPVDGSAWQKANGGDCSKRILRGSSWDYGPAGLPSASRVRSATDARSNSNGFRIARTLLTPAAATLPVEPPAPTAKSARPAGTPPPPAITLIPGLNVAFGETIDKVRAAYNIRSAPTTDCAESSPCTMLVAPAEGLTFFFTRDKWLYELRADAPFSGSIEGVRIGDALRDLITRLGQPTMKPDKDQYAFVVRGLALWCQVDGAGNVVTIFAFGRQ